MNVFKIAFSKGEYSVSIHGYPGGDVVPYETAKALADELAAERAKVSKLTAACEWIAGLYDDSKPIYAVAMDAYSMKCEAAAALNETKPNEPKRIN